LRGGIVYRLRGAYRGFMVSATLSVIGLFVDLGVYLAYGSVILLTDLVHWAIDAAVEVFGLLALYYAVRVGRRFPWSVLALESAVMLVSIVVALGVYVVSFASYFTESYMTGQVTTTSLAPVAATLLGGVFTLIAMVIQRRNYEEYGLEVLRADYMHALVDLVAAFAVTVGIVLVYHTGSEKLELFFVLVSSMFIVHSLLEILRDVVRTITGENVDYELSARLLKRLVNEQKGFRVEDVVARRIGSFYIVEVKVRVDPREKLETLHRLRGRIARSVLEESSMIYHVDVRFYPDRARRGR